MENQPATSTKLEYFKSLKFLQLIITILGWLWIGGLLGLFVFHSGWVIIGLAIVWLVLRNYEEHQFKVKR